MKFSKTLANASLLAYPSPDAPTCLMTDASDMAVRAVLQQNIQGTWKPISFFSLKMTPAETRYSTFDWELLAVYLAIKQFRHILERQVFHILTDHKPLTYALNPRSDRHSPRQARHLNFISQFTPTVHHVHGMDNVVADALSRIKTNAILTGQPPNVDFTAMAAHQSTDPLIGSLQSSPSSTLVVEAVPLANSPHPLYCDTSIGMQRPIVLSLGAASFVWPGINCDVRRWTCVCIQCQHSKVQRHAHAPLLSFPILDA